MSTPKKEFTIVRKLKAPKEMVFNAFSEAKAMGEWWGPVEMPITVVKFEFKPKGIFHFKMEGNGEVMWARFTYGQIAKPDLIEFINSFSDEHANICRAPFSPIWPLEIYNKITLTEANGITTLTISGYPINSTEEEDAMYYSITESMEKGFGATFDQLEKYLAKHTN